MLPTTIKEDEISDDFIIKKPEDNPTKTYFLDLNTKRVKGLTDKQAAMKQAVFKILQTERFSHRIYSDNYGSELAELIGKPITYVIPEIERRIKEALLWDERITKVYNFSFDIMKKTVIASWYVDTIFGTIKLEGLEIFY